MNERRFTEQTRYFKELTLSRIKEIKAMALESSDANAALVDLKASIQTFIDYSASAVVKASFFSLQIKLNKLRANLEANPWLQILEFLESYETIVRRS